MSNDDPRATTVLFIGIASAVAVFLIVVLLQIVYHRMQETETTRKARAPEELAQLRAAQQAELTGYAWIDEGQGVVRIPVERAMELTVEELNRPAPPQPLMPAGEMDSLP